MRKTRGPRRRIFKSRTSKAMVVAFLDVLSMLFISYIALWIRYDFQLEKVPHRYVDHSHRFILV
ncbi:MAG: hypothetical protein IJ679_04595, partial [Lachnospiraceae bacterium]|nr:hypothetical protein [Lachnospiraceae bacterium]